VLSDEAGELDERANATSLCPGDPLVEEGHGVWAPEGEDLAELLFQEIGPIEALVGSSDGGERGRLAWGEVGRVLPEGEA